MEYLFIGGPLDGQRIAVAEGTTIVQSAAARGSGHELSIGTEEYRLKVVEGPGGEVACFVHEATSEEGVIERLRELGALPAEMRRYARYMHIASEAAADLDLLAMVKAEMRRQAERDAEQEGLAIVPASERWEWVEPWLTDEEFIQGAELPVNQRRLIGRWVAMPAK